jgi:hypothetical protein
MNQSFGVINFIQLQKKRKEKKTKPSNRLEAEGKLPGGIIED